MKEINKIICIGANCISLDFSKTLGIREKGPVDNFAGFNIWNSPLLFNNEFKKIMFKDNYIDILAGEELLRIVPQDNESLKADIYVDPSYVARVKVGNPVRIKFLGLAPSRYGRVIPATFCRKLHIQEKKYHFK